MNAVLVTGACKNTGVSIVVKFAKKGKSIVFTGRTEKEVRTAETEYKKNFSLVTVTGYTINSLLDDNKVDEESVRQMFEYFDAKKYLLKH